MDDVVIGVPQLHLLERAAAPIRPRLVLGQFQAEHLLYQAGIAHLVAESEHRRGQLGIEQGLRQQTPVMVEDLQVLTPRMPDLDARRFGQQGQVRRQVFDRERIDAGGNAIAAHLQQAQLRIVGLLAEELGV